MKTVQRLDIYTVDRAKTFKDDRGFLHVPLRAARTGVQDYGDHKEFRPDAEVFSAKSLGTFNKLPVTDQHPPEMVTAANASLFVKGLTEQGRKDGRFIVTDAVIFDETLIAKVEDGDQIEVSQGYTTVLDERPGEHKGEKYDLVQTDIVHNHTAIVTRGRAGAEVRILMDSDGNQVVQTAQEASMKIKIDGKEVEVSDEAGKIIQAAMDKTTKEAKGLQTQIDELGKDNPDLSKTLALLETAQGKVDGLTPQVAELEGTVDGLKTEIEKLKDPKHLDTQVAETVALRDAAAKAGLKVEDTQGMDIMDLKKAIVMKALDKSEEDLKDKAEAYIDGLLSVIGEGSKDGRSDAAKKTGEKINDALHQDDKPEEGSIEASRAKTDDLKQKQKDLWKTDLSATKSKVAA